MIATHSLARACNLELKRNQPIGATLSIIEYLGNCCGGDVGTDSLSRFSCRDTQAELIGKINS
ncbi:hypothetical protein VI817_009029 [Penicillium citrinum]|nr:hypothetical protein VI817_009029 [Penicillium citrinum]